MNIEIMQLKEEILIRDLVNKEQQQTIVHNKVQLLLYDIFYILTHVRYIYIFFLFYQFNLV